VNRIALLAQTIARELQTFEQRAARAAKLSKADLLTQMVGEFPELQGVMGRYYALQDGEDPSVATAIEEHYRPRFAGDAVPATSEGTCVALADKLETLVGFFGIGEAPTGDKDPFGLRRAALGVLRILAEGSLPLDLRHLLGATLGLYAGKVEPGAPRKVHDFMLERLRGYLRERGYAVDEIESVISQQPSRIDLVMPRLDAVRAFRALPEAESLAAANKRIRNILKKAPPADPASIRTVRWESGEEAALFDMLNQLSPVIADYFGRQAYKEALLELVKFRRPVDDFFDKVMVMAEDPVLRNSRLGLLRTLDGLMNQVADISKLAA
jgi:glycyl-tRNA synthetase beta chain